MNLLQELMWKCLCKLDSKLAVAVIQIAAENVYVSTALRVF